MQGVIRMIRRRVSGAGLVLLTAFVLGVPASAEAMPGDLDPTFGQGGLIADHGVSGFYAHDTQGSAVYAAGPVGYLHNNTTRVLRFNARGKRTPAFGDAGQVTVKGAESPRGLTVLDDGRFYLLADISSTGVAVYAFDPDGAPDESFGDAGRVVFDDGVRGCVAKGPEIDSEGRILLTYKDQIIRLMPDGTMDASFQGDPSNTCIGGVQVAPDGSVYYLAYPSLSVVVRKLNPDGSPDEPYGTEGTSEVALSSPDCCPAMALGPTGTVTVAAPNLDFPGGEINRLDPLGQFVAGFADGPEGEVYSPSLAVDQHDVTISCCAGGSRLQKGTAVVRAITPAGGVLGDSSPQAGRSVADAVQFTVGAGCLEFLHDLRAGGGSRLGDGRGRVVDARLRQLAGNAGITQFRHHLRAAGHRAFRGLEAGDLTHRQFAIGVGLLQLGDDVGAGLGGGRFDGRKRSAGRESGGKGEGDGGVLHGVHSLFCSTVATSVSRQRRTALMSS